MKASRKIRELTAVSSPTDVATLNTVFNERMRKIMLTNPFYRLGQVNI